jgi:hypothetical protein
MESVCVPDCRRLRTLDRLVAVAVFGRGRCAPDRALRAQPTIGEGTFAAVAVYESMGEVVSRWEGTRHRMRPLNGWRSIRLFLIVASGAAVVTTGLLGLTSSVGAKGPESATVTGPGIEEPIELLDVARGLDPSGELERQLMHQTGLWSAPTFESRQPPTGELGPAYTLTWINSGPPGRSVESRTIRQELYPDADGGSVIHTPPQAGLEGWGPEVTGWFDAPNTLWDTLAQLGLQVSETEPTRETDCSNADESTSAAAATSDSGSSHRRAGTTGLA